MAQNLLPSVYNYTLSEYQGASKNWGLAVNSRGELFAANNKGLLHYDGEKWTLNKLPNNTIIRSVKIVGDRVFTGSYEEFGYWTKDDLGNKQFTNYSGADYFQGQRFWSVFADSKGIIWAGAVTGIYRFDGKEWASFALPYPAPIAGEFITQGTTWGITEDSEGNIWFSTNGLGAFKYDGKTFTQYAKKDGLTDNSVDDILADSKGNIWFGTRFGGVSRFDGTSFTNFTSRDSIGNDEVCVIYEDRQGDIWFSSEGYGVYRYDGTSLTNYREEQGLGVRAVQSIFEDKEGRLWAGGGGGLYRLEGDGFIKVTKEGPWESSCIPSGPISLATICIILK